MAQNKSTPKKKPAAKSPSKGKSEAKSGGKVKYVRHPVISPAGTLAFTWVHRRDSEGKYADNKFKTMLAIDDDQDLSKMEEVVQKVIDENPEVFADADPDEIQRPFIDGTEYAEKKENSEKYEDFKGKTLINAKSQNKPKIIDSKRKTLPHGVEARSGDVAKLALTASPYTSTENIVEVINGKKVKKSVTVYGVNFYLDGVQLLEKRNFGSNASNLFEDEDGFEADESYEGAEDDDGETEGSEDGDF